MQLMHHSEFDIFKMECRMVADKFNDQYPSLFHLHLASQMLVALATDQQAWPIVWHHTRRHVL